MSWLDLGPRQLQELLGTAPFHVNDAPLWTCSRRRDLARSSLKQM
jgi:hypothetical protein